MVILNIFHWNLGLFAPPLLPHGWPLSSRPWTLKVTNLSDLWSEYPQRTAQNPYYPNYQESKPKWNLFSNKVLVLLHSHASLSYLIISARQLTVFFTHKSIILPGQTISSYVSSSILPLCRLWPLYFLLLSLPNKLHLYISNGPDVSCLQHYESPPTPVTPPATTQAPSQIQNIPLIYTIHNLVPPCLSDLLHSSIKRNMLMLL